MSATTKPAATPVAQPSGKPVSNVIDPERDDFIVPDNYVTRTVENMKMLPPVTWRNLHKNIQWISFLALTIPPAMAIYGLCTVPFQLKTFIWSVVYYFITGLGITAGYHRLWAHRSYHASTPLAYFLALAGAGGVQGSI
jgi:stearoyl-CoA desaturase (delta-9 desaturase)